MAQQIIFFLQILAAAEGLRLHVLEEAQRLVETKTAAMKMGAAFGGGGCYSAVSQLGFLRGLLADDMGNGSTSLTIDSMGTTSGGSWSLAMFFNNMPNGIDDLYWRGNYVDTSENPVWQNELGKWCMYRNLHHGISRDKWGVEMQACGRCLLNPRQKGGCSGKIEEMYLGLAERCIKGSPPDPEYPPLRHLQTIASPPYRPSFLTENPFLPPHKETWPGKTRERYILYEMNKLCGALIQRPNQSKAECLNMKLPDLKSVGKIKWSIQYARWAVPARSLGGGVTPRSTDRVGDIHNEMDINSDNLARMVAYSSDAVYAIGFLQQLGRQLAEQCTDWTKTIGEQTAMNSYPFPFSVEGVVPEAPLLSEISKQFGLAFFTDGLVVDNNAIGLTLALMESSPEDERPESLVALVTGHMDGQEADMKDVLGYFKPRRAFGELLPFTDKVLQNKSCSLVNQTVVNPNYYFDWDVEASRNELPSGCVDGKTNKMLDPKPDSRCWNLKYQADRTGTIFVRRAKVVPNKFWGIKGGWNISILFTILDENHASEQWVKSVFGSGNDPDSKEHLAKLEGFPKKKPDGFTGLDHLDAFALMNYNAYKGYMTTCALLHFKTKGQQTCKYCQFHPEDCKEWLPFV